MSSAHRKLARLPVDVFENLKESCDAADLRALICSKLKRFKMRGKLHGSAASSSIKTVGEFLLTPKRTLLHALDPLLTFGELELLWRNVSRECSSKPTSALELMNRTTNDLTSLEGYRDIGKRMRYLPTGLPSLDLHGPGGVHVGSVTEVLGRAGAGKTQLALHLILMAAKYRQGAIYVDTEKKLILDRLREMIQASQDSGQKEHGRFPDTNQVLGNVTIKQPHSAEDVKQALVDVEEEILHRNQHAAFPVRLLIVDSIAAPLKKDFGSDAAAERASTAFTLAQSLKRLADQLHLAVVVINQVGVHHLSGGKQLEQVTVRASLGTSWHHCVSTRLLLEHEFDPHRDGHLHHDGCGGVRVLSIVKSNVVDCKELYFKLGKEGVMEVRTAPCDEMIGGL